MKLVVKSSGPSFSTDKDSLSQWRAYADDDGYGVALGFDPRTFGFGSRETKSTFNPELSIRRVRYKRSEQIKILDGIFARPHFRDEKDLLRTITKGSQTYYDLWDAAAYCKNSAFKIESEWRIIYSPALSDERGYPIKEISDLNVIVRGHTLVPYYVLPILHEENRTQPIKGTKNRKRKPFTFIKHITFGPKVTKDTKRALEAFMVSHDFQRFTTSDAKASYRTL